MSTSKIQAEAIALLLNDAGETRLRSMMGEYLLYLDGVLIGQVNNGELFIKATAAGEALAVGLTKEPPYPGAKPAFKVPAARFSDSAWLTTFVQAARNDLAKPVTNRRH
jgi:TfoX/Sxy family transcriptional regulator of competence genes